MSFGARLNQTILSKYKNIKHFVESTGMGRTQIDLYVKGSTLPSIKKVEEFAQILDVSASWLAYGIGTSSEAKEDDIIDLISLIHKKIDQWLISNKKEMDFDKKAILVKVIYKKLQLKDLNELSSKNINRSIDDIIEILAAAA